MIRRRCFTIFDYCWSWFLTFFLGLSMMFEYFWWFPTSCWWFSTLSDAFRRFFDDCWWFSTIVYDFRWCFDDVRRFLIICFWYLMIFAMNSWSNEDLPFHIAVHRMLKRSGCGESFNDPCESCWHIAACLYVGGTTRQNMQMPYTTYYHDLRMRMEYHLMKHYMEQNQTSPTYAFGDALFIAPLPTEVWSYCYYSRIEYNEKSH